MLVLYGKGSVYLQAYLMAQGFPVTQHPEAAAFGLAIWVGFFLVAAIGKFARLLICDKLVVA